MKEKNAFDLQGLYRSVRKYWYFFPLGLALALAANFYLLRRTQPVYATWAQLLIKDDENSGQLSEEVLFAEMGLTSGNKNLENEAAILSSSPLLTEVVKELGLQYRYFRVERFLNRDLYKISPIRVTQWNSPDSLSLSAVIYVERDGGYRLETEIEEEELEFTGEFGKPIQLPTGELTLTLSRQYVDDFPIAILVQNPRERALSLKESLSIASVGEESSIVELRIEDYSKERARDILNALIHHYNAYTVEKRNSVFRNTINLVNNRIALINQELTEAEMDVEDYKQQFSMVELSSEGTMLMEEISSYNRDISENQVQLTILESIEKFLVDNREDFEFVPTNASLNNLTLSNQLLRFNELLAEHEEMLTNLGPEHPDLKLVKKQLQNFRNTIIENIRTIKGDIQVALQSAQSQQGDLQGRIQSLPQRERELLEIERRKGVMENLYLYLLQKREESAISMAASTPRGEVVEPPSSSRFPIEPNKPQHWLTAVFLGLAMPTGLVLLLAQLNDRIETEKDLLPLTDLNLVGTLAEVPKKKSPTQVILRENSRTAASEMFRMLRSNLSYLLPGDGSKVIMVTSCISGEGKSFTTLNLAMVLALSGKRVVVVQADMRKPADGVKNKPRKNAQHKHPGLVNYIIEPFLEVHQVIQPSGIHANFDVIGTGPKPPNPGELIISERIRELVDELRKHYDFIFFDTPPLGVVADVFEIKDMVDATLLVARARYTRRGHINLLNKVVEEGKLPKPSLVLNAVSMRDYNYGKYGYGYNYLKSNTYFEDMA